MNTTPAWPDAFGSYVEAQLRQLSSEMLSDLSIRILKSYSVLDMWYLPVPSSISLNGRQLAVDLLLPRTIYRSLFQRCYTHFFGAIHLALVRMH